jgi:hypothetical protein
VALLASYFSIQTESPLPVFFTGKFGTFLLRGVFKLVKSKPAETRYPLVYNPSATTSLEPHWE